MSRFVPGQFLVGVLVGAGIILLHKYEQLSMLEQQLGEIHQSLAQISERQSLASPVASFSSDDLTQAMYQALTQMQTQPELSTSIPAPVADTQQPFNQTHAVAQSEHHTEQQIQIREILAQAKSGGLFTSEEANEFVRLSAQLPSEQQAQIYRELSLAINQGEIELTPDVLGVLF